MDGCTPIERDRARELYAVLKPYLAVDDEDAPLWKILRGHRVVHVGGRYRAVRWTPHLPVEDRRAWRRPTFGEFVELYGLEVRDEAA